MERTMQRRGLLDPIEQDRAEGPGRAQGWAAPDRQIEEVGSP